MTQSERATCGIPSMRVRSDMIERNDEFDDLLDDLYGEVVVAGMRYAASDVLANVDPIAYRVMLSDWESEREDWEDDMTSIETWRKANDEPLPWTGNMVTIHSDPDVSHETLLAPKSSDDDMGVWEPDDPYQDEDEKCPDCGECMTEYSQHDPTRTYSLWVCKPCEGWV